MVVISTQDKDHERKLRNIYLFNKVITNHQQSRSFLPKQFPALQNFNMDFDNMWSAMKNPDSKRLESTLFKAIRGD